MVKRLTTTEDAHRLRNWFLKYMKTQADFEPKMPDDERFLPTQGWLVGPSQVCRQAGLNVSIGTRLFSDAESAKPYVPFPEFLSRLTQALRRLLQNLGYPRANQVTEVRAFIEAGYLSVQNVRDFLEAEGLDGWMREEDAFKLGALDLRELPPERKTLIEEMYHFEILRAKAEEPDRG